MAGFDYDVLIIGSGFGGSVAAAQPLSVCEVQVAGGSIRIRA